MTTAGQHQTHTTRRTLLTAAAVTTTLAVFAVGCASKAREDQVSSPSPSLSPSTSASADPEAAEKSKALAAYSGFWTESVKAYEAGSEKDTKLVNYASKDALNQTLTDIANMQRTGTAMKGTPGHRAEVTALNLAGQPPTAKISDCFDLSTWKLIDRATGQVKPFPTQQPLRYITEFDAELQGGQWVLTKFVRRGDQKC